MAWVDDDDDLTLRPNVFQEILAAEEELQRRRHRPILVAGPKGERHMERVDKPSAMLQSLRAGKPTLVPAFKVPQWARAEIHAPASWLRVHPDGHIEVPR